MTTLSALEARVAELEEDQVQLVALSQMSRDLSAARDESDILQILAWPTIETNADVVMLIYIDLDADGEPMWAEVVAHWRREGRSGISMGTRWYLPECPLAGLWLADPGDPQLVADVTTDERLVPAGREMLNREGIRTLAVLPMSHADRWVGLAVLGWDEPHPFSVQEAEIYRLLSGLTCPVVKSLRLTREAQSRVHELSVLNELGQTLTTRLKVMGVLEEAFRQASRLIDASNFYVALYDHDKNEIYLVIDVVDGRVTKPYATWKNRGGFIEHVIRHRKPVIAQDTYADWMAERQKGVYKRISLTELGVRVPLSVLGVPLIVGDEVLGMMAIRDYDDPRAYDEHDLELMTSIASPVAITLQNAQLFDDLERMVAKRTAELRASLEEQTRLQQQVIEAQQQALLELSTPIIPVVDRILVMPLIGSIDAARAREITRSLLAGIREHRARVVILDITGVHVVDSGVADHLNKTVQAARLKGARTIITGISDGVAETIVDLGIDWSGIETLSDLQSGLIAALGSLGVRLARS